MTEREIFWHNFRSFRSRMAGKSIADVKQCADTVRLGPFGLFTQALPAIIAAELAKPD